jgi:hypothetical protein
MMDRPKPLQVKIFYPVITQTQFKDVPPFRLSANAGKGFATLKQAEKKLKEEIEYYNGRETGWIEEYELTLAQEWHSE